MRKTLQFVSFVILVSMVVSCNEKENLFTKEVNSIDAKSLLRDNDFNIYIDRFEGLTYYISKTFNKHQRDILIDRINNKKSQNSTISQQCIFVAEELQVLNKSSFINMYDSISHSYINLQNRYGKKLTKDIFIEAIRLKSLKNHRVTFKVSNSPYELESACGLRYTLCSAAASFEGGLLLAACEAASGGTLTPLCLAGAVTWTANEISKCADQYCN